MTEEKLQNLFFALWPDDAVRAELSQLQQGLSVNNGRMHHHQDLHMTLVFLGRVSPEKLVFIQEAAAAISSDPFTLDLTKIDYWKPPKIVWCGPDLTPDPLARLVRDLQHAMLRCGFEPEKRSYKPHVTLARKARYIHSSPLEKPITWRPKEFVLAGSGSGAKSPRYRILGSWNL